MSQGVQEKVVYDGPEGKVYEQDCYGTIQFHARTFVKGKAKGRYYGSKRGAIAWLKKQHPINPVRG